MTQNDIIDACCKAWNITKADILGKRRYRQISSAKHYARYLMSRRLGMASVQIAKVYGCKHSTVLNSLKQVEAWNWQYSGNLQEQLLAAEADRILKKGGHNV